MCYSERVEWVWNLHLKSLTRGTVNCMLSQGSLQDWWSTWNQAKFYYQHPRDQGDLWTARISRQSVTVTANLSFESLWIKYQKASEQLKRSSVIFTCYVAHYRFPILVSNYLCLHVTLIIVQLWYFPFLYLFWNRNIRVTVRPGEWNHEWVWLLPVGYSHSGRHRRVQNMSPTFMVCYQCQNSNALWGLSVWLKWLAFHA